MLQHRFFISFVSTVFLYAIVGSLLFTIFQTTTLLEETPKEKTLTFSLSEYVPQEPTPIKETIEEEKVEPEPEPIIEKGIEEEPKVEEKLPEPKPVIKKIVKKKPVVKKKRVRKTPPKKITKKHVRKKTATKRNSSTRAIPKQVSTAKKNSFLNQVRKKIDRAKTYPRAAKRRGMQGSVNVKFTILPNGQVGGIHLSGPKIFHSSARSAVKSAFPINVKNVPISLPQTVNVTLRYQLK